MSLIATPQEIRQQKLILVLVAVVLVIIVVVYFGFFRSTPVVPVGGGPMNTTTSVGDTGTIGDNLYFLEDSRFQSLKKYGSWPIETGKTGRENPFNPSTEPMPVTKVVPEEPASNGSGGTSTVETLTIEDLMKLLEEGTGTSTE